MAQEQLSRFIETLLSNEEYREEIRSQKGSALKAFVHTGEKYGFHFNESEIVGRLAPGEKPENGDLYFADNDGSLRLTWVTRQGETHAIELPLSSPYVEYFESMSACPQELSVLEGVLGAGFLAATLDGDDSVARAREVIKLMTEYGYEVEDAEGMAHKIQRIYEKSGAGPLFNGVTAALDDAMREHAFAISAQMILKNRSLAPFETAFLPHFSRALGISANTATTIMNWAKQQIREAQETEDDDAAAANYHDHEEERERQPVSPEDAEQFAVLQAFFEQDNWPMRSEPQDLRIFTTYQGRNAQYNCVIRIRPGHHQMVCYSLFPQPVPENKRQAVAEFLTRANYGTIIGNFELDFNDGEVRYKTSLDYENNGLNFHLIRNLIYPNVLTMDRYISGVFTSIYSGRPPADIIQEIERG